MQKLKKLKYEQLPAFSLVCLAIALIYSYSDSSWIITATSVKKLANTSSIIYIALIYGALLLVLISTLVTCRKCSRGSGIYIVSLLLWVCIYSIIIFFDEGSYYLIYSPTTIFVYLFQFCFFLGENDKIWDYTYKIIKVLGPVFLICSLYEAIQIYMKYGIIPVGNSSMIYFYVAAFWLIAIKCAETIINKEKLRLIEWVEVVFLIFLALTMNSRSWVIQSVLLFVILYLLHDDRKSIIHKFWILVSLAIITVIIYFVIINYLPDYVTQIINKMGNDSRSHQYRDIFEATRWYEWGLGKGLSAMYPDSRNGGMISNIDNQFLYIAFHYGIITLALYIYNYIKTIIAFNASNNNKLFIGKIIIIMWLMALGGLSVFNVIYADIKSFVVPLFAGHIYRRLKDKKRIS